LGHQADGIAIWIAWRTKSGRYIIFEVSLVVPSTIKLLWPHGEWRQKRRRARCRRLTALMAADPELEVSGNSCCGAIVAYPPSWVDLVEFFAFG
jgi:hypothetical protein